MKLLQPDETKPVLMVELPPRTELDYRDRRLDTGPYLTRLIRHSHDIISTPEGSFVVGLEDPDTGISFDTMADRPVMKIVGGDYHPHNPSQTQPCYVQSTVSSYTATASELAPLLVPKQRGKWYDENGFGVTKLTTQDYVGVFFGDKVALEDNFVDAVNHLATGTFDRDTAFTAVVIVSPEKSLAAKAVKMPEAKAAAVAVPVDRQLRPRVRWNPRTWTKTDEVAFDELEAEQKIAAAARGTGDF
jgi:hypothetical protein